MPQSSEGSAPAPFIETVFHPSDFSDASQAAFAHALAVALVGRTRFDLLNVRARSSGSWKSFPSVRETLARWGLLAPGSDRSAVYDELSVRVRKVQLPGHPVEQTLRYVDAHRPDLLVVATAGRRGIARLTSPSVAQAVARRSQTMTLFVGAQGRSFVSFESGHLSLRRILVPVNRTPAAQPAVIVAARLAETLGDLPVEITLLHVGDGPMPPYDPPEGDAWIWRERLQPDRGPVVQEVVETARELDADLIVMATDGRQGVLDAVRGSTTERIVPRAPCPVLAVPTPP